MNNVENFSRQSDAKIKVLLPGGKEVTIGINVRPHWEEALNIMKEKYHIILIHQAMNHMLILCLIFWLQIKNILSIDYIDIIAFFIILTK